MNSQPAPALRVERKLHLTVAKAGRQILERHPNDGWKLATPYPLGRRASRVLTALIVALCPGDAAPHSADLLERVQLGARHLLSYMHPTVARALAVGLKLLDFLPLLTLRSASCLHRLGSARTSALFTSWGKSPFKALRLLVTGVRSLILSVYFDQTEVHAAMHYAPVPFMRDRITRRARLLTPATAAE